MTQPLTVLVDERCEICVRAGMLLGRRHGIVVLPIGSPTGARLLRDLPPAERYAAVHAVDQAGRRLSGGAALPPILRRLPGGRLTAGLADAFPLLTDAGYRLVARNRAVLSRAAGLVSCGERSRGHLPAAGPGDESAHIRNESGSDRARARR